jgi:phosphoserine aminotransferase
LSAPIYFTPGPSELYPTVGAHIQTALEAKIPAISHRGKTYQEFHGRAVSNLRELLGLPSDWSVLFLSSANEIWERALQNTVGHKSAHLVNGSFSKKCFSFASDLGLQTQKLTKPEGESFRASDILLESDVEALFVTHNETSTGASMPVDEIHALRKQFSGLIFVDAVSSLPYPSFDFSKIDSVYFSVQKCFGLPAGLGVWLVNNRVKDRQLILKEKGKSTGTYHRLDELLAQAEKNMTPETPNVLNIFLLSKVTEDLLNKGIGQIRRETEEKASALYVLCAEENGYLRPFVKDSLFRSATTIVAETSISPSEINKQLASLGMAVGSGYGNFKDNHIRIANFPAHSPLQMEQLIDALKKINR